MDKVSIPEYTNYTVKNGDTIYSISKKYGVSVDQIMKDNALSSPVISVGMNLKIRTISNEVEECFGREFDGVIPSSYTTYTVKAGDSLYKIAKQ
ncbi:MAG: LysM peptidoglycan-binding domain-containing protein, partial [Bacilli bacterium]|nr:LysM peptidoglycan-binding domain-containing protein [Bacilli bacterium]